MDGFFGLPPSHLWLIAGAMLICLEAFGIPGIGLLFGGLAAVITGLLIESDVIAQENLALQFGAWFGLGAIIAALLWKPLKNWRNTSSTTEYTNMVGTTATVCDSDLVAGKTGKALWSGTRMNAELSTDAGVERLMEGDVALITAVEGNILKLKPHR